MFRAQDDAAEVRAAWAAFAAAHVAHVTAARGIAEHIAGAEDKAAMIRTADAARAGIAADFTRAAAALRQAQDVARIAEGIAVRARTSRFTNADAATGITAAKWVAEAAGESVAGRGRFLALRVRRNARVRFRQDRRCPRRRLVRSRSVDAGLLHPTEAVDMRPDHCTRNKQNVMHQPALHTGFVFWVDARPVQTGYLPVSARWWRLPAQPDRRRLGKGSNSSLLAVNAKPTKASLQQKTPPVCQACMKSVRDRRDNIRSSQDTPPPFAPCKLRQDR